MHEDVGLIGPLVEGALELGTTKRIVPSVSLPSFYIHVVMSDDIARPKSVEVRKMNILDNLKLS